MQAKLDKSISRGKLSEVQAQKEDLKISKQLLKIKELEADLAKAQEKLEKLKR